MTDLYNKVARSGSWPKRWKVEHSFSLKKIQNPESLNDVQAISRSPFLSAQFEKIVVEWLLEIIGLQIDWAQYGGQKGCSITHLIIELITFIQYNPDLRSRQAVAITRTITRCLINRITVIF